MLLAKQDRYSQLQYNICGQYQIDDFFQDQQGVLDIQELCLSQAEKNEIQMKMKVLQDFYSEKS